MFRVIKDFLWGTFNRRNKGIVWYRWPVVGWWYMQIGRKHPAKHYNEIVQRYIREGRNNK